MEKEIDLGLDNLKIAQLGFVYKDVRKQAELMETFFGIPKFIILGPVTLDTNYRGKDTTFTVTGAFAQLFNGVEVELIEYHDGECIHKEFLDQNREGLHHIRYDVEDISAVIEKFDNEGIKVIQSGKIMGGTFAYMDTESILDIIIEFAQPKKKRRK